MTSSVMNKLQTTSILLQVEMSFILWRCKAYWKCVTHKNSKASQIKGPKPQGIEREVPFFFYMIPRVPTQRKTIPLTEYNIPNSCTLLQESYSTKFTIVKSVWICSDIIRLWQSWSGHTFHFTTKNYWWYLPNWGHKLGGFLILKHGWGAHQCKNKKKRSWLWNYNPSPGVADVPILFLFFFSDGKKIY